ILSLKKIEETRRVAFAEIEYEEVIHGRKKSGLSPSIVRLLRYGRDFDAVAEVLGTKTSDKVKSFYTDMKADIDKMSSENLFSPVESTGSSIPVGAEAVKYNNSHHHRPASSRKLFVNPKNENSYPAGNSSAVDNMMHGDGDWEESESTREEVKMSTT
ncbi:hypothetical protein ANCDUO_21048, partial [Ancylostoma duodenale]